MLKLISLMISADDATEKVAIMGSSHKEANKILGLITEAAANQFLLDLANFRSTSTASWLLNRNKKICADIVLDETDTWFAIIVLQRRLQKAWDAPDAREREWYCFQLRTRFLRSQKDYAFESQLSDPNVTAIWEDPPPETPFEAAIFHLQRIGDRLKHCGNTNCPAPYFIATKRWQKYCSEKCAGPANREAKRKWWHEHKGRG